jgi:hypothetical protein
MQKRVHIVGCSPRSGTTLIKEMMVSCFKFNAYTEHERSIFKEFNPIFDLVCSKNPLDTTVVGPLLKLDSNLSIIYMLRDPRDTLSSRSHRNNTKQYWSTLGGWLEQQKAAEKLANNPRFLCIRYEELVNNPDIIQQKIQIQFEFLEKRHDFSTYHLHAKPAKESLNALVGLKPVNSNSVGQWRKNKAYIKAQMKIFGDISNQLIALGYEKDKQWLTELEGVTPDNSLAPEARVRSTSRRLKKKLSIIGKMLFYFLNKVPVINKIIFDKRSSARPEKFKVINDENS